MSQPNQDSPGVLNKFPLFKKAAEAGSVAAGKPAVKSYGMHLSWQLLVFSLAAFLLARAELLGGLYPFAPAVLAALIVCYRARGLIYVIPILVGFITVMSGSEILLYAIICALLGMFFTFYPVDGKRLWYVLPTVVLATVLVCKGLVAVFWGAVSYEIFIALVEGAFAAGLSLVFMVVLNAFRRFDLTKRFSSDETICLFVIGMGVICGMSNWTIAGISIQAVASCFLILAVAYLGGGGVGAAMGTIMGIVPSLSTMIAPSVIATYAFSGLLAGIFSGFGRFGTVLGFFFGNMILSLYLLSGMQITSALSVTAISALIFLLIPNSIYRSLRAAFINSGVKTAKEDKNERILRYFLRRIHQAGVAYHDLSKSLTQILGQNEKEMVEDNLNDVLKQFHRQLCTECSLKDVCWRRDYANTVKSVVEVFNTVEKKGYATRNDIPEILAKRCPHVKELTVIVNCLYEIFCRNNYWKTKQESSANLLSVQIDGVSQIFDGIVKEINEYNDERLLLETELRYALQKRELNIDSIGISSLKEKSINVWVQFQDCPGEIYCREALEDEVSSLLGHDYYVCDSTCSGNCGERCTYKLLEQGANCIHIGKAQLAKDGKGICGDSGVSVLLEEGKQLLIISDGMGIGQKAATESDAAVSLLIKLLELGFSEETAIDTVNSAFMLRGNEDSFVTLDLCFVDLINGNTQFIKTGGAPSFIKRGRDVKIIQGSSLPVGMLHTVQKDVFYEAMQAGDMVILASDGLWDMDTNHDLKWLQRTLSACKADTPQEMAEYILEKVVNISGGKIKDDITVLVAQMEKIA